jgi:hypothetical protein
MSTDDDEIRMLALARETLRQEDRDNRHPRSWVTDIDILFDNADDLSYWLDLTNRQQFDWRNRMFPGLPPYASVPLFPPAPSTSRLPNTTSPIASFFPISSPLVSLAEIFAESSSDESVMPRQSFMADWAAEVMSNAPTTSTATPLRAQATDSSEYDFGGYEVNYRRRRRLQRASQRRRARSPLRPVSARRILFEDSSDDEAPTRPALVRQNAFTLPTRAPTVAPPLRRVVRPTGWQCSICQSDDEDMSTVEHSCGYHIFHRGCIEHWTRRNRRCPNCRRT